MDEIKDNLSLALDSAIDTSLPVAGDVVSWQSMFGQYRLGRFVGLVPDAPGFDCEGEQLVEVKTESGVCWVGLSRLS